MRVSLVAVLACVVASLVGAQPSGAQPPVERGRYLVEVVGACGNCHSPKAAGGEVAGKHLAGGFEIREGFGVSVASNIPSVSRTYDGI